MPRRLHVIVRGEVQMVGFRYFVVQRAQTLGLAGWVRNRPDGAVEVVAEGDEAALQQIEAALRDGPRAAQVDAVDATWSDALEEHRGFELRW